MKCMMLTGPGTLQWQDLPDPTPGPDDVVIRVETCGVSGFDVQSFRRPGEEMSLPIVQGRHFAGTVAAAGANVFLHKPGQRVFVEPIQFCGTCYNCRTSREHICANPKVMGRNVHGAFAEYVAVPDEKVQAMPGELSFEDGAMVDPVAAAVRAVRRAELSRGERVVVLGAGTMGLMLLQAAKAKGARALVVAKYEHQAVLARQLDADFVVGVNVPTVSDHVRELKGSKLIEAIFVAVSDVEALRTAFQLADPGTRIIIIASFAENAELPVAGIHRQGLEIVGSSLYRREDFMEAFQLVQLRRVRVRELITHRFPLAQLAEAYQTVLNAEEPTVKVMIECSRG